MHSAAPSPAYDAVHNHSSRSLKIDKPVILSSLLSVAYDANMYNYHKHEVNYWTTQVKLREAVP